MGCDIDYYYCHHCGLELLGDDCEKVGGFVQYANGWFAQCPKCSEENSIEFLGEEASGEEVDAYFNSQPIKTKVIHVRGQKHTDRELLNFLEKLNIESPYTGKYILRNSTRGKGWRLHETSRVDSSETVREAIIKMMEERDVRD